ncbi:hypothetical protein K1T35_47535 (plasmid) [Pseudonocardia sp. DSM 110487]|uniref:hypothetical protein n=1 Tax=Pseudonocardia sp. DSM 110487 TaxID=2865833 RepID=UPI001C69D5D8|nr:hypothetical protein [Pseudonocardia sp. DSM 110487]QYN41003.1 hypothetical protein K1T35_47535 [Pseudonocardia sp. DSM 110487]
MLFDDPVNTSSELWKTCIHEAAHAVVRRKLGFTITLVWVEGPGRGWVNFDLSRRLDKRWTPRERDLYWAVGTLAGPDAHERLQWFFAPKGCEGDRARVDQIVSRGLVTYAEVEANTKREVSRGWGTIKREARSLYLDAIRRGIEPN